MRIEGYAHISRKADCNYALLTPEDWRGKILPAMELNDSTESALMLHSELAGMGMFDYKDILMKFKCTVVGEYILPPNLTFEQEMIELSKRQDIPYGKFERALVISQSLIGGVFNDSFLFKKKNN